MRKTISSLALAALVAAAVTAPVAAQESSMSGTTMVGGQAMYPSRNIVENAVNSADHTTLVKLVKAAGLVGTLEGKGPFTVFAPVNSAFDALPPGTAATLLKPENKATLTAILTYHVVAGTWDAAALRKAIADGNGTATLHTVNGGTLTAKMNGPMNIVLVDAKGNVAHVTTYDVRQSNGVIQVIDRVLMPGM